MSIKQRARELQRSQTEAERVFWSHVRGWRLYGFKLRRQHPIGPFIEVFEKMEGVLQTVLTVLNEASPSPRPSPPKSGEKGKQRPVRWNWGRGGQEISLS